VEHLPADFLEGVVPDVAEEVAHLFEEPAVVVAAAAAFPLEVPVVAIVPEEAFAVQVEDPVVAAASAVVVVAWRHRALAAVARAWLDEEPKHRLAVWEVVHQRSAVPLVVEEVSDVDVVLEVDLSAVVAGWTVDHQTHHPEKEAAAAAEVVEFPTAVPVAWAAAAVPVVVAAAAAAVGEEVG